MFWRLYAAGKETLRQLAERFAVSYGWVAKIHAAELGTDTRRHQDDGALCRLGQGTHREDSKRLTRALEQDGTAIRKGENEVAPKKIECQA